MSLISSEYNYIYGVVGVFGAIDNKERTSTRSRVRYVIDQDRTPSVVFDIPSFFRPIPTDGYIYIETIPTRSDYLAIYTQRTSGNNPPSPIPINGNIVLYGYAEVTNAGDQYPPGSNPINYTFQGYSQPRFIPVRFITVLEGYRRTTLPGIVEAVITDINIVIRPAFADVFPAGFSIKVPKISLNFYENDTVDTISHDIKNLTNSELGRLVTRTPSNFQFFKYV